MSYYVKMRVDNYILDRYGFEAWIHATIVNGKEIFYAHLYDDEEYGIHLQDKFETFAKANEFLVESIKKTICPIVENTIIRGNLAIDDLERLKNNFNL